MARSLKVAAVISALCTMNVSAERNNACWRVDKTTVMQGGCVTVIVNKPCSESNALTLQIGADKPVPLLDSVGPSFHHRTSRLPGREATLVQVYHNFRDQEAVEEIPGARGTFRLVPVFDQPGQVRLTLYDDGESLGSIEITVVPSSKEARAALELLNPPLTGRKTPNRDHFLWHQLVTGDTGIFAPPLTDRELQLLRDELPIVVQHPDWSEIARMRLAKVEALHYVRKVASDSSWRRLRDDVVNPKLPAFVTECINMKVQSPFAQAVQDNARDIAGMLTVLLKHRERERANDSRQ